MRGCNKVAVSAVVDRGYVRGQGGGAGRGGGQPPGAVLAPPRARAAARHPRPVLRQAATEEREAEEG